MQVRDEVVEATLSQSPTGVTVPENGDRLTAESWVVRRLARLPQLAERICSHDESPEHFIVPSGRRLGHGEFASDAADSPGAETGPGERKTDVVAAMAEALGTKIPGTTSVWYLTSDAGEGKTPTMNTRPWSCTSRSTFGAGSANGDSRSKTASSRARAKFLPRARCPET